MKTRYRFLPKKLFDKTRVSLTILLLAGFCFSLLIYSQGLYGSGRYKEISFEDRLAFYLNQISKPHLNDMVVREKFLLQLIENIIQEIKKRGQFPNSQILNEVRVVYGNSEQLVEAYSNELNLLIQIIDEIDLLKQMVDPELDRESWSQLENIRSRITKLIEDNDLRNKSRHQYYAENVRSNSEPARKSVLADSARFKAISEEYLNEVQLLKKALVELDRLLEKTRQLNSSLSYEIEDTKRVILNNLDAKVLSLMGYEKIDSNNAINITEAFNEWKAREYIQYQVVLTRYLIIKKLLLQQATSAEKTRMLKSDLRDALTNYRDENFPLAIKQFDAILDEYNQQNPFLATVLFYRAESYFIQRLYQQARADYERLAFQMAGSQYFTESVYRLLMVNNRLKDREACSKYARLLQTHAQQLSGILRDKTFYLAGYLHFKYGDFEGARKRLAQIPKESAYYLSARYLAGVVEVNLRNYASAEAIFNQILQIDDYPSSDREIAQFQDKALLKLGYLNYESGNFQDALFYFNSLNKKSTYFDKALLGAAWANLKLKNYEHAIANVKLLVTYDLASLHTYEALTLSAHCKKILNQHDSALRDLNYISEAREALEIVELYNSERRFILNQLMALEEVEKLILEHRDKPLYETLVQLREQFQQMLEQYQKIEKSGKFEAILANQDGVNLLNQLEEFTSLVTQKYGETSFAGFDLEKNRKDRFSMAMQAINSRHNGLNSNYYSEYPLASQEGMVNYRKKMLDDIKKNIQSELEQIEKIFFQLQNLQRRIDYAKTSVSTKIELEILQNDINRLKDRSTKINAWLVENHQQEMNTQFDHYADFSGFGLSNVKLTAIAEKKQRIMELSQNGQFIHNLLQERKNAERIKQLEEDWEKRMAENVQKQEKILIEQSLSDPSFKESYFDLRQREVEEK
ncbi:MAG: hypothetical protein ACE5HS_02625 [bacterium]